MPGASYVALSGMRARLDQLDRLASDIANVGTAGYKGERTSDVQAERSPFDSALQTAIDVTTGSRRLDVTTGSIEPTGRPLDLAIQGKGFFAVETPAGVRYTRNGHFSRGTDGTLITDDGASVLDAMSGTPITVGKSGVGVDPDGTVHSDGSVAGKIQIVEFDDAGLLVRENSSNMRADGMTAKPATKSSVASGALEQSNVSVAERIAELTNLSRTFDALQKAVSLQMNDLDGKAIDQLGRR